MPARSLRGLVACAATAALLAAGPGGPAGPAYAVGAGAHTGALASSASPTERAGDPRRVPQTSDGVRGRRVAGPAGAVASSIPVTRQLAPGVRLTRWTTQDARGPQRLYLIAADLDEPGVRLGLVNPGHVAATATVRTQVGTSGALAAVNGDFYDIGRTGAPLGFSVAEGSVLAGRAEGWDAAFLLDADGVPQVERLDLRARVPQLPGLRLTNVNSHFVAPDGIGLYTPRWSTVRPGYDVTQGGHHVFQLRLADGVVVSRRARLTPGRPLEGQLLIGRGTGADRLRRIALGTALTPRWMVPGRPRLAVTGSTPLVDDGVLVRLDDRVLQPRTAIGVDRDTNEVLLLAVDGRTRRSRGATLAELARLMADLGADEALNLDGGGSTTVVARDAEGTPVVVNRPSDGFERKVSDVVGVFYTPPPA